MYIAVPFHLLQEFLEHMARLSCALLQFCAWRFIGEAGEVLQCGRRLCNFGSRVAGTIVLAAEIILDNAFYRTDPSE